MKSTKKARVNSLRVKTGIKAGQVIGTIIGTGTANLRGTVARYIEVKEPDGSVSQWVRLDDLAGILV